MGMTNSYIGRVVLLCLVIFGAVGNNAKAQSNYLEFVEAKRCKSSFQFDEQWKYLTTEIYPYNFNYLPESFRSNVRKNLQSIYIYAKLHGGEYDNIEYPLYFYQTKDKVLTVRGADKVMLLKGLPIDNEEDIDADITINGITAKSKFLEILSEQVDLLSNINNPLLIPKLMDRFKDYKVKFNKGYEYSYTKTIPIYEDTRNRKIHSVSIYYIRPASGGTDVPSLSSVDLQEYINRNADIDSQYLSDILPLSECKMPFVAIVNYLSKRDEETVAEETASPKAVSGKHKKKAKATRPQSNRYSDEEYEEEDDEEYEEDEEEEDYRYVSSSKGRKPHHKGSGRAKKHDRYMSSNANSDYELDDEDDEDDRGVAKEEAQPQVISVFISSAENNFGQQSTNMDSKLKSLMSEKCTFVEEDEECGFKITLKGKARQGAGDEHTKYAFVDVDITVYDCKKKTTVYSNSITAKGGHTSWHLAGKEAYNSAAAKIFEAIKTYIK